MNQTFDDIEQCPVWDKSSATKRLMGDEALLSMLIDKFNKLTTTLLPELETALIDGSLREIEMSSHKLKGGASAIGAVRVAIIAEEIEGLAKNNAHISNHDLMTGLTAEVNLFFSAVKS
ncbi:MAG: Hpt domain-containing protein [Methylophaga sp.]|nr:Hpt domain-containing protein [Methylophaga sp.]